MDRKSLLIRLVLIMVVLASLACNLGAISKRAMGIEPDEEEESFEPDDYHSAAVEGEPADDTESAAPAPDTAQEESAEVEPTVEPTPEPTPEPTEEPVLNCVDLLVPGFKAVYECGGGMWQLMPEGRGKGDTADQYTFTVSDDGVLMVERHELTYDMVIPPVPAVAENDMLREFTLMHAPALCLPEVEELTIPASQHAPGDGEIVWSYDAYYVTPVGEAPFPVMGTTLTATSYESSNAFTYVNDDGYNRVEQWYSRHLLFYYDAETGLLLHSESFEYLDDCSTTDDEFGHLDCPGTGLHNYNICELIEISLDLGM
ncbi:MAG: hypothetical protein JXJ17_17150 [Anaerolineae bacterium]|nr:hypothetical protein [Anaerolineae bacterium]